MRAEAEKEMQTARVALEQEMAREREALGVERDTIERAREDLEKDRDVFETQRDELEAEWEVLKSERNAFAMQKE